MKKSNSVEANVKNAINDSIKKFNLNAKVKIKAHVFYIKQYSIYREYQGEYYKWVLSNGEDFHTYRSFKQCLNQLVLSLVNEEFNQSFGYIE